MRIDLGELHRFSEKLGVPDAVTEEATVIYEKALARGLAKGRSIKHVAVSSLYVACREDDFPTTLDDVAIASGVSRDDLGKCYRLLVTELNLKIPVADPSEYLERVASRAKVSPKVEADASEILSKATEAGVTAGMNPAGLAASALYLASLIDGVNMTQAQAAEAAGVQEATIRKQCKSLRKIVEVSLRSTPPKRRQSV